MVSTLMVSTFSALALTKVLTSRSPVSCLISLEVMAVCAFLLMSSSSIFMTSQTMALIMVTSLIVCEGVLGLGLISPYLKSTSSFMTLSSIKII
nr:NADH dehydrogenase subunit 4L [Haematomyzus cf. elephantis RS460]